MAGLQRKKSEKYLIRSSFKNQIDSKGRNKDIKTQYIMSFINYIYLI